MRNKWMMSRSWQLCVVLAVVMLLAGCARTPEVSFYQLSPRPDAKLVAGSSVYGEGRTIGVGPVQLPEYLERIQLVSRVSANRLEVSATGRWAEPLADGVPRVLIENLVALRGHDRFLSHPWPRSMAIHGQVVVELLQFEGGPQQPATLIARWSVLDGAGRVLLAERRSRFDVAAAPGQEGQVAALSDALGDFAREIASALGGLSL